MSSINPFPTFNYLQPESYRFSHDSVFLARHVFELVRLSGQKYETFMDLCSGCGVVGLDFIYHLKTHGLDLPRTADFLEVQEIYKNYFNLNSKKLDVESICNFLLLNYSVLINNPFYQEKYDLIISNPPYFRSGHGAFSPDEFKNRCRFFLDATFKDLVLAIESTLNPMGVAYVLVKDLEIHGIQILEEIERMNTRLKFKKLEKIRKTDLIEFRKN